MPFVVKHNGTEAQLQTKMASTPQGLGKETQGHTRGTCQADLFPKNSSNRGGDKNLSQVARARGEFCRAFPRAADQINTARELDAA